MSNLYRTETLRRIEGDWLARLPAGTLMERAAEALARTTNRLARALPRAAPIAAMVGPGNNGGDALLALSLLAARGFPVRAFALAADEPGADDARAVWRRWLAQGGRVEPLDRIEPLLAAPLLVVDGLFGIGLQRPLQGAAQSAVARLSASDATVVAVDVPSGIDADRGCVVGGSEGAAVRADVTVTMIGDKPGLHTGAALDHAGSIEIASLGLTDDVVEADGELFDRLRASGMLHARARDTHKGSFGAVVVIGGATGTTGAALLAALGAQSAGAGKVFVASPDAPVFHPGQPQLMTRPLDRALDGVDAVCIGCGLGVGKAARQALAAALRCPAALVIDADALNLVAAEPALARAVRARSAGTVLTPPPLEAARLLEVPVSEVQADRVAAATALAERFGATAVLKGAGTLICDPGERWSIVDCGTPALASAGTGDVLAGCIAALVAQGRSASESARLGVWVHGRAARLWQREHPHGVGLSAARLPDLIVEVVNTP